MATLKATPHYNASGALVGWTDRPPVSQAEANVVSEDGTERTMRQADYPMGTTQAMHDAAFNPTHDDSAAPLNEIIREVESRAEDEIRTAHQTFVDWLADYGTPVELARMLAFYKTGDFAECRVILDDVTARYQQYRTATLDAAERAEIEREL